MEKVQKVIKVLADTLMTLILIVGVIFIFLFIIGFEPFVVESGSMRAYYTNRELKFYK